MSTTKHVYNPHWPHKKMKKEIASYVKSLHLSNLRELVMNGNDKYKKGWCVDGKVCIPNAKICGTLAPSP